MAPFNKSKMAAAAILNFGKMSITPDWIKISAPNFMRRCITAVRRWSCDQKSKPEVRVTVIKWTCEHKCVDLSYYDRYLNHIWYRAQIPHYQHARMVKFTWPEIQDGRGCHLEFRKNVNNSGLDKDICTTFYGKMHHGHAEMIHNQKSKPEVNSRDVIKRMSETYVRQSQGLQQLSTYRSLF